MQQHGEIVMAATAQLRKCEELLGKLPEKLGPAARLARNPVLVFLKGLEGFDTERASDCLVKLVNKHYDTIEVLKLATKSDLVEDAGILPGDALRIVAAAKEYVAPRDPNLEAKSQCDHAGKPVQGVEHRQDAYRPPALRETTVLFTPPGASQSSSQAHSLPVMQQQQQKVVNQGAASQQEAVKEGKGVNQVEPKQAVKDAKAPTLPPSRGAFMDGKTGYAPADARFVAADPTLPPPWRGLVDGKTGFVYYWNPVMNITQYDKPLPAVGSGPSLLAGPPPPVPPSSATSAAKAPIPQTVPTPISYPHICRLCDAKCISEDHIRSHYNGQRHNTAVREAHKAAQAAKAVIPAGMAAVRVYYGGPSRTQEDASGSKQPSQSLNFEESLHACGVCILQFGSEIALRSHFNSKKHAKKMELATDSKDNRPTPYLYCSICDVSSMSKKNLVMHFNGKRHVKNMKEDSNSGNSSYYSDSEIEF